MCLTGHLSLTINRGLFNSFYSVHLSVLNEKVLSVTWERVFQVLLSLDEFLFYFKFNKFALILRFKTFIF